ncbi:MAG TPA: Uma2 family endonuclease [Planctomycetota bacterium]|jgi:Uma2 family endonuclease
MSQNSAVTESLITADELLQHPEWEHCELVEGRLVFMAPAGFEHGDIAETISFALGTFVRQHSLGRVLFAETGFFISRNPDTTRVPDVMFYSKSRLPGQRIKGFLPSVPDLAVEIVSPSDTFSDVTKKAESYTAAGIELVWVIDPQTQRAYVFRPQQPVSVLSQADSLSGENVLPGFAMPLNELFE